MVQLIERDEGYYESRDLEAGKAYRWRAERVAVACATDHTTSFDEEFAARRMRENTHPWRSLHYFAYAGAPF